MLVSEQHTILVNSVILVSRLPEAYKDGSRNRLIPHPLPSRTLHSHLSLSTSYTLLHTLYESTFIRSEFKMPSIHKPLTFLLLLAVASLATPVDSNAPVPIICNPGNAKLPICNTKRDILADIEGAPGGDGTSCQQQKQELSNVIAGLQALDVAAGNAQRITSVECQTGCSGGGGQVSGNGPAASQGDVSGSP